MLVQIRNFQSIINRKLTKFQKNIRYKFSVQLLRKNLHNYEKILRSN